MSRPDPHGPPDRTPIKVGDIRENPVTIKLEGGPASWCGPLAPRLRSPDLGDKIPNDTDVASRLFGRAADQQQPLAVGRNGVGVARHIGKRTRDERYRRSDFTGSPIYRRDIPDVAVAVVQAVASGGPQWFFSSGDRDFSA